MKKKDLQHLLKKLNIQPSKKLGQNFLTDENLLNFIYKTAAAKEDEFIIEIGSGLGVLTKLLVKSGADIIAIEYDARLAAYLKKAIQAPNLHLIHQDACKLDFNKIIPQNRDFRIIANLPYSISTPLIAKFINMPIPPKDMLFLLQKETAERFAASAKTQEQTYSPKLQEKLQIQDPLLKTHNKNKLANNNEATNISRLDDQIYLRKFEHSSSYDKNNLTHKSYGSITAQVQNVYEIEYLRTVPPDVFFPKPIVQSAITKFTRKEIIPTLEERKLLKTIVRTAFSKRRKKMINNLQPVLKNIDFKSVFDELKIDQNTRAENLTPSEYLALTRFLLYRKR
jgi:16S rRNA A1518/A1519 N6-dimethyltransferase RsmA/KsgA/DIM1 with predicted DNA glycosylase/AP lyase activity